MEKAAKSEKLAVEAGTGIVARKAVPDGYSYQDRETGEPVDPMEYKAKYMKHMCTASSARRRRFAPTTLEAIRVSGAGDEAAKGHQGFLQPPTTQAPSTPPASTPDGACVVDHARGARGGMQGEVSREVLGHGRHEVSRADKKDDGTLSDGIESAPARGQHKLEMPGDAGTLAATELAEGTNLVERCSSVANGAEREPSASVAKSEAVAPPEGEQGWGSPSEPHDLRDRVRETSGSHGSDSVTASFTVGTGSRHTSSTKCPLTVGTAYDLAPSKAAVSPSSKRVGAVPDAIADGSQSDITATAGIRSAEKRSDSLGSSLQQVGVPDTSPRQVDTEAVLGDREVQNISGSSREAPASPGVVRGGAKPPLASSLPSGQTPDDTCKEEQTRRALVDLLEEKASPSLGAGSTSSAEKDNLGGDRPKGSEGSHPDWLGLETSLDQGARGRRRVPPIRGSDSACAAGWASPVRKSPAVDPTNGIIDSGNHSSDMTWRNLNMSPLKFPVESDQPDTLEGRGTHARGKMEEVSSDTGGSGGIEQDCESEVKSVPSMPPRRDRAGVPTAPRLAPRSGSRLEGEIAALENRLFAALDELLEQHHADVARLVSGYHESTGPGAPGGVGCAHAVDKKPVVIEVARTAEPLSEKPEKERLAAETLAPLSSSDLGVKDEAGSPDRRSPILSSPIVRKGQELAPSDREPLFSRTDVRLSKDNLLGFTSGAGMPPGGATIVAAEDDWTSLKSFSAASSTLQRSRRVYRHQT